MIQLKKIKGFSKLKGALKGAKVLNIDSEKYKINLAALPTQSNNIKLNPRCVPALKMRDTARAISPIEKSRNDQCATQMQRTPELTHDF